MDNRERDLRESAYRIWEAEGRPEGQHDDHWRRAEEQHQQSEREAGEAERANRDASRQIAEEESAPARPDPTDRPPSLASPD